MKKAVCDKYRIKDNDSEYVTQYLYQETRCRHHFGKNTLSAFFNGTIQLSPLLDPKLRTLKLNSPECPDYNLLIALIFVRYAPDLLKFPFQGKRSIAPETIEYAKKINARFPRPLVTDNASWGGYLTYCPATLAQKKSLPKVATTKVSPQVWRSVA